MGLAGNVANMLATCRPDSQMLAHYFADMPLSWQYKIDPDTHFCVGDGQHSPLSSFRVPEVHTDNSSVRPGMRVWLGEAERNIKKISMTKNERMQNR